MGSSTSALQATAEGAIKCGHQQHVCAARQALRSHSHMNSNMSPPLAAAFNCSSSQLGGDCNLTEYLQQLHRQE